MLHWYMDVARRGLNFWKSLLFEEIRRRDLRIGGVCQTRKLAVANKEWEVTFKPDTTMPEATQKEVLDFVHAVFEHVEIVNFFTDCVEAQLQGVSTFEVDYAVAEGYGSGPGTGARIIADKIRYIPNHLLAFDDVADEYKYLDYTKVDAMKMRTLGWSAMQDRVDLTGMCIEGIHPYKLIEVHSLDGNAQNGFLNGCIDSLIWAFLFKNYGLKDWSIYIERFATPILLAKFPALMGTDDKNRLISAVDNYGTLLKLIVPDGTSLDTLGDKDKSGSGQLFSEYTGYWNTEIAIRVLGQSLSTGTGGGTGMGGSSYALGKVHNAVREDLVIADMMLVKRAVNQLIQRLVMMNFAGGAGAAVAGAVAGAGAGAGAAGFEIPKFSFKQEKDIEFKKTRSEIFRNLKETGWKVSQADVEEEFDIEVEEIAATAAGAQGGAAGAGADGNQYIDRFIEDYFDFTNDQ